MKASHVSIVMILGTVMHAPACIDSQPPDELGQSEDAVSTRYGVDYAWARPSPAGLHLQGYTFVARYLSYDTTGKSLSHAEASALIHAGLDVVVVWEQGATDALSGYNLGRQDAQAAAQQAAADGAPATRPIYFAVDFDATPGEQVAIDSYFDGVASVIGRPRTGAYAGYWVIKRLFDAGKIRFGWQTYAWSGGLWDPRAQLRQIQNGIAGGQLDKDQAVAADFGQWGANAPPRGSLDVANCSTTSGWSQDPTSPTSADNVHVYFDSVPGQVGARAISLVASQARGDLCGAIGSCNHAFSTRMPLSFRNNGAHVVRAFGIDLGGGPNSQLTHSPRSFTCSGALPAGVRRWVINPTAYAAWKFDAYWDVMYPSDSQYNALVDGANFPTTLRCMHAVGQPAMYVYDSGFKRHIVNPTSAAYWRIKLSSCETWTAAQVAAVPSGPAWRLRPTLANSHGKIVVIDDRPNGPATYNVDLGEDEALGADQESELVDVESNP